MDEPFGAVDPIVRERLQNEFLRLQEQLAKTILFVTHDIDEAIKMGDLVAVFRAAASSRSSGRRPRSSRAPRRTSSPASWARTAASSACRWPAWATSSSRRRRRRGSATTPRTAGAGSRADPFPYLLLLDADDRPLGWVDDGPLPGSRPARRRPRPARRRRSSTAGRRSRTRCRCCSTPTSRSGIVVDRRGAFRGLVTVEQIADFMRESAARPPSARRRRAEPTGGADGRAT